MELYTFKVNDQEDVDFVGLMALGLEQIKEHYKPENDSLIFDEESDLDYFGIINSAATIWSERFLMDLKDVAVGNKDVLSMTEKEMEFIQYTTKVYLSFVGDKIGKYGMINIDEKFKYIENKNKSKHFLKIVK